LGGARRRSAAAVIALALLLPAGGVGAGESISRSEAAGPIASKADESLVGYVTRRWIPIRRVRRKMELRIRARCQRGVSVRTRMLLRWPGEDLGPYKQTYSPCGWDVEDPSYDTIIFEFYKGLTRSQVLYLRAHRTETRLVTRIRGYDPGTGELDFDRRVFRFTR
jgi:hypothetical protein